MKVYFLEISGPDLEYDPDSELWVSPPVDLYNNNSYTNYSVVKSDYGFTPERANWIGTKREDSNTLLTWEEISTLDEDFPTDTGLVEGGRYVDTSGRIDIISFNLSESAMTTLTVYHSDTSDDEFYRDEWDHMGPTSTSQEIALVDASRYGKFVFDFGENGSPSPMFVAYIRVEIDRPVMMPLYRSSRQLLDQFPEWMTLADVPDEQATPEMATPTSVGGSFLNAVAGEWLDDIRRTLSYRNFQKHVTTGDIDQMAWAWKSSKLPRFITSITGDGVELARTADQQEFREAVNDDACFVDFNNDVLYATKKYDQLLINDEPYNQEPHHMWNYFDEVGLFIDLPRISLEGNEEYQTRILDVYRNRGGVGVEQLKHALRRELSMWKYFDQELGHEITDSTPGIPATPDSDYIGATPVILDMDDLERQNDPDDPRRYFDLDGMPTPRFVELVETLSRQYPTTWSRFHWGEAVWDLGGKDHSGYSVTPYRFDAQHLDDPYVQSGVGDGDDLFVFKPDVITGPREFNAKIKARGKERVWRTEYPAVRFDINITGIGMRDVYSHPEKTVAFTLEIVTNEATPRTFVHSFTMTSKSDVDVGDFEEAAPDEPRASEAAWAAFSIFSEDETTNPELAFRHPTTNALYEGSGVIPFEDIETVRLIQGTWQAGSYIHIENSDHFEAWFSTDPEELLTYDSPNLEVTISEEATPSDADFFGASVVMRSIQHAEPVPTSWTSQPPQMFTIPVNGVAPYLEPQTVIEDDFAQWITWDPYVTDRAIQLDLLTIDSTQELDGATPETPEWGGLATDENNEVIFIPAEYILVNGVSNWEEGIMLLDDDTESLEFSIDESNPEIYPITFPVWELFEAEQTTTFSGIVDENGPWRNGIPSAPGNTNFNLEVFDHMSRDDLDVPNSEDFIITWMGVESDNNRVIVWLDNNTVKPAVVEEYIEYPETAIEETYDEGEDLYRYSSIVVRARIRPGPDPQWSPQIHSGYFYDRNQEYYFYANKKTEIATTDEIVLEQVARQGAPIIVVTDGATPELLRQVAFFDEDATPSLELSLYNNQWVPGTGHDVLYVAYADIYDITVEDKDGNDITLDITSDTNIINTNTETKHGEHYLVRYRVRNAFYADYDHVIDGEQFTRLVFDSPPESEYHITYESSTFDPATPVDLPLNPLYSMRNEGFIFISHNEYTLDSIRVRLSPAKILADGVDYMLITIDSMDEYGNPKPEQDFALSTTFGTLDKEEVTTDHDGFAVIILSSEDEMATPQATPTEGGTLSITGAVSADINFDVEEPNPPEPTLAAVVKSEKIQADGVSQNIVFGKIESPEFQPLEGITVHWRRARSLYELFTEEDATPQTVTTNQDGIFAIGPFTTSESGDSGYWFMELEAEVDNTLIGDVVFWYEYPSAQLGVENTDGIPQLPIQMATPVGTLPPYADTVRYPVSYDEQADDLDEQVPEIFWLPPTWYAIAAWRQYQLGIKSHKVYKLM